ncbi:MAG: signal peptidase I [Marinomonas sp.]
MNEKTVDTNAPVNVGAISGEDVLAGDALGQTRAAKMAEEKESFGSFLWFLLKLALAVLIFRSFIFSPFSIPSESMLPRLWNGDYLLASKWSYGISKHSLPFSVPIIPGRIFGSEPERGDVVIFKHPVDGTDYIKRAIALPGDTVAIRRGQLILNGAPVPKQRIADFVIPVSPNTVCSAGSVREQTEDGAFTCRYARFRETLPSGVSYNVLDFGASLADDYGPKTVPEGRVFVMGDNRDNSLASRFPAEPNAGVGLVPQDNLVGKASVVMFSTDGSSEWVKPWTWFSSARWDRMFSGI